MNSTIVAVAESLLGVLAFSILLLPPGFLLAHLADFNGFRARSTPEKTLWSVALGTPLAITLSDLLGRHLAPGYVLLCFGLIAIAAIGTALSAARQSPSLPGSPASGRALRWGLVLAAALALYPSLALTDVQIGHRLFMSTVMSDWAVRVPIVNAAMHGTVPPLNPLSDLHGHVFPLRYYYFWYVLCARVAQLAHIPARAAFTASCTWAAYGLLSVFFLSLKYLLGLREHLRRQCLLGALLGSILGLDILFVIVQYLSSHLSPNPEMDWWREDRTASFLSAFLYAPHHVAGMVSSLAAFLLLVGIADRTDRRLSIPRACLYAAVAGMCFSATAGTSTFVAFIFVIVFLVWAVDLLRTRRWHLIAILAGAGVVAIILAHPFLHELQSGSSAAGSAFAVFRWRSFHFVRIHLEHNHIWPRLSLRAMLIAQAFVLVMDVFEFGFFLFVFAHRVRRDLFSPRTLTSGERALWSLFLGVAIPVFFISSATTRDSSENDLGIHAGILLRFVLLLMATPWVYSLWQQRLQLRHLTAPRKLFLFAAASMALLGITASIYQVVIERFYATFMEQGVIHKRMNLMTKDRLSYRLYNIRSTYQALNRVLPPSAVIQFNPQGRLQTAFALYSNRQIGAYDDGCGTAFGGDLSLCPPIYRNLSLLYGIDPDNTDLPDIPFDERGTTETYVSLARTVAHDAEFLAACRQNGLSAILVESTDPIWKHQDSWVWTRTPASATDTTRSFLCPSPPPPQTP